MAFSVTRLIALTKKESKQIVRDPSNALIAVVIPLLLLFIFGYGINLDANKVRLGVIIEQPSQPAQQFLQTLQGSPFIEPVFAEQRQQLQPLLEGGNIRGMVIIPVNFAQQFAQNQAQIQLITDGSEPNIANFVQAYLQGIWQLWLQQQQQDQAQTLIPPIQVESRFWFNAPAISKHFILPGAITIIMTVIGSILTALVIAREWERGTMESLLATPMSKVEFILSKLLPYYILGLLALIICWLVSVFVLGVPYRGSLLLLWLTGSLFLFTVLGMGLLISTIMNNQFNAAMVALNAAFLPAVMLSGFVFEIDSMPLIVKLTTYLIPARYFVAILQTLFLAGNIGSLLLFNSLMLIVFILGLFIVTLVKTKLRLD